MTMLDIPTILDALGTLGRAAWPVLWLPVLLWTAGGAIAEGLVRMTPALPVLMRYRLRQAVLAALPTGLFATLLIDAPFATAPVPAVAAIQPSLFTLPTVTVSPGTSVNLSAFAVLGMLTVGAGVIAIIRVGRLAVEAIRIQKFRRLATEAPRSAALMETLSRLSRSAGVTRHALPVRTTHGDVPMLLPGRTPLIVLPAWMADGNVSEERLKMALVHELVHLDRYDDIAAVIEQIIAGLAAGLPLVGLLTRRIAVDREAACDARVIHLLRCRRGAYARLLTDVATKSPGVPAVALSESSSSLEQRLRMMTHSSFSSPSPRLLRLLPGTLLALLVTAIVACSTDTTDADVTAPEPPPQTAQTETGPPPPKTTADDVYVVVADPPKLLGGLSSVQEELRYPEQAADNGEEGRVFIQFVVTTSGKVTGANVTRGVSPALDAEALRVVRQLEFEPGQKDGNKVNVQMSLPVTFRLPDDAGAPS